jgi:uncharacterized repeat protein (TIGR01451 family)
VRLFVNGLQVASASHVGRLVASHSFPVEIGGDSVYGQYFTGLIDEVRVYNVALSASQIEVDMNTPVSSEVAALPDVTVGKTHSGTFTQGQTGATYTVRVSNVGAGATSGTVSVSDTLPVGLTATGISGAGWTCSMTPLGCTRGDVLNAGASYPNITVTVTVASNAPANVTNTVTVSGAAT